MNKSLLASAVLSAGLLLSAPAFADWDHDGFRGGFHNDGWGHRGDGWGRGDWDRGGWNRRDRGGLNLTFAFSNGGYYGRPYHPYRPSYYGYPTYYAPPPVLYASPPTMVYQQPTQVVYAPSPNVYANQVSQTYIDPSGQTCREYQSTGSVGGRLQQTYGTACLQPDGSWRIVQ